MTIRLLTALCLVLPVMLLTPSASFADTASDTAACDALAAHPDDLKKPEGVAGVTFVDLKLDAAIAACEIAIKSNPDSPRIKYQLARVYFLANRDPNLTLKIGESAAQTGYPIAIDLLARFHEYDGIFPDAALAGGLYCKAFEAGHIASTGRCGLAHREGHGFPKDQALANTLYQKGAEAGDIFSINELGFNYEKGIGLPIDLDKAVKFYTQSAERGDNYGMNNLGNLLVEGLGTPQNVSKGLDLLNKAMEAGSDEAPLSLAKFYNKGNFIPYNGQKAAEFYLLALKRNDEEAKTTLIEGKAAELNATTIDAIQAQLQAEGKVFEVSKGTFTPDIIAILKTYSAK
jgi:uncharacterized protein